MTTNKNLSYARALFEKQLFDEAIKVYRELFEKNPKNKTISYELALSICAEANEKANINEFREAELYFLPLIIENNVFAMKRLAEGYIQFGEFKNARKLLLKLLKMQENRDFALFNLARLEQLLSNDKEEEKYLIQLIEIKDSEFYLYGLKKLMNYYIKKDDYKKAEEYFYELVRNDFFQNDGYKKKTTKLFLDYMQKRKLDTKFIKTSYFANQLVNYNKQEAIKHINNHKTDTVIEGKTLFLNEIDITELYEQVSNIIKKRKPRVSAMTDLYLIRLDKIIGTAKNTPTDTINVITNHNTKQIITMYPVLCYILPQDEIEYDDNDIVVNIPKKLEYKRESQIEKFNRRYKRE